MKLSIKSFPYVDSARLFADVVDQPWAIFLDSGVLNETLKSEKNARYDVLACQPITTLVTEAETTTIERYAGHRSKYSGDRSESRELSSDDPIALLKKELSKKKLASIEQQKALLDIPYTCGAYGYFSYDLGRRFENLPEIAKNDEQLPEMAIGIYSVVVVIDHVKEQTYLISLDEPSSTELIKFWQKIIKSHTSVWFKQGITLKDERNKTNNRTLQESLNYSEYVECFNKVRDYIVAGDCYQVNLAKRFSVSIESDAWQTYADLRESSPAPYGAYLNLPFAQVLSNSPESFLRCHQGNVVTSPIKGTRPRDHGNPENDRFIAQELYNSEKDRAENVMIVDLMRNDLSRCCELDSVKVPKLFEVHSFANVHHLISKITGKLKAQYHSLDLLRSCFPGGSITGAPKIRAMQIIEELEPHRRGLYCGSIGYVGVNGDMETNIAIRTIVVKDGLARFSAGGGLVINSDVESEHQEVIDKAEMMRKALLE